MQRAAPAEEAPPYLWAFAAFAVIMAIYTLTLSPTTAFWDTSEYIAAAKVLGIPHPPGNPLFTLMAHVWGMLPLAANYAKRINFFAAFTSASAAGVWFLVAERWMRNVLQSRPLRIAAAFAGIFASAMAWTVWNQSTVNEKVYTVSLLSIALIVWCMVRWADLPDSPRRNGLLVLACYLGALTSTNHMMGVLAVPVIAVYVVWTEPRLLREPWVWLMAWTLALGVSGVLGDTITALVHGGSLSNPPQALTLSTPIDGASGLLALTRVGGVLAAGALFTWGMVRDRRNPLLYVGAAAVLIGLTLNYVYLPLRAGQYPPINEGEPVGFFSQALSDVLHRLQYAKPPVSQRMSPFAAQIGMYWHYWTWQWAKDFGALVAPITGLFTALCAFGLAQLVRKDRRAGAAAGTLLFILTLLLVYYLNFRYRWGYPGVPGDAQEVRERDYFFLASFAYSGVLLAIGFGAAIEAIAASVGDRLSRQRRWVLAAPVLALALVPLFGNRLSAPRNHETLAADFAVDMLNSVDPYGILVTAGDNDTFPLWFAQEVLGVRRDVTLANLSLMGLDWHLRQLQRRVTPAFDPAAAPALWRPTTDTNAVQLTGDAAREWVKPAGSVFDESIGFLDSIPDDRPSPRDSLQLGHIWIKFNQPDLLKRDEALLFLIKDSIGKRSVFFSWSDAAYPDSTFGLGPYLVTQGMVRKLMPSAVAPAGPVINSSLGLINVPLTRELLFDVYHADSADRYRPLGWFDPPSASILGQYEFIYGNFSQVEQQAGDSGGAIRAATIATRIDRSMPR